MAQASSRLAGLTVVAVLAAVPAPAEISSLVLKTTNKKVGFL